MTELGEAIFDEVPEVAEAERLTLDLEGWEGSLDLLLSLARTQKVDLREISILELVEQYLAFITDAKALKLEIAADYLVIAAWLAYLKSCLLLPKEEQEDPGPEELALRLQRLDAMRATGARLMARNRIGRDVFLRGAPEGICVIRKSRWQAGLYDLIAAYGQLRARTEPAVHIVVHRSVMTLEEALERLERLIGQSVDWAILESFVPESADGDYRKSALASSFVAALELARQGKAELRQEEHFSDLMVRTGE